MALRVGVANRASAAVSHFAAYRLAFQPPPPPPLNREISGWMTRTRRN